MSKSRSRRISRRSKSKHKRPQQAKTPFLLFFSFSFGLFLSPYSSVVGLKMSESVFLLSMLSLCLELFSSIRFGDGEILLGQNLNGILNGIFIFSLKDLYYFTLDYNISCLGKYKNECFCFDIYIKQKIFTNSY